MDMDSEERTRSSLSMSIYHLPLSHPSHHNNKLPFELRLLFYPPQK